MRYFYLLSILVVVMLFNLPAQAELPKITGKPVIDAPLLLDWPMDRGVVTPNLNDPTANILNDFHAQISECDLVFSTEGNYYPALKDIWPVYLAKFKDQPLLNWFYTTSPPVAWEQVEQRMLQIGNLYATCRPAAVVATPKVIGKLQEAGQTEGPVYPLFKDRGQVLLVKKGNPKKIHTVWDLGRKDVRLVTPNPELEAGAFKNYAGSIFNIAAKDPHPPKVLSAGKLFNLIFNGGSGDPEKWLCGFRIHHRDEPWSVAYGKGDVAVIYYHLGLYTQQTFPDKFDLAPLGGTLADPQPLAGTISGTRYLVRLKGDWTSRQLDAREKLVETLLADEFTKILEKRGLLRPPAEKPAK